MPDQPETQEDIINQRLLVGIGGCIMQWSLAEMRISAFFHLLLDTDNDAVSTAFWRRIRSFETKLQIVSEFATASIKTDELRRDWNLVREHVSRMYALRNKIAHSTPLKGGGKPVLEPFAAFASETGETINVADLHSYAKQFHELVSALDYIIEQYEPALSHPEQPTPATDLIHRLRRKDDQRREAQRHRDQAWRQYVETNPDLNLD